MPVEIGPMKQIAFVVPSLETAMSNWHETTNVGPFYVIDNFRPDVTYRGVDSAPLEISVAMAGLGDIMVELVEQHSVEPSVFRDVFGEGEGGLHHIGYLTKDIDEAAKRYQAKGFEIVMYLHGEWPVAYFDTRKHLGAMTELIEAERGKVELFEMVIDSARQWDGNNPIRTYSPPD